jgi:hypothetical protein
MQSDWETIARSFGYETYDDLLKDLYLVENLPIGLIARKLSCSHVTIARHLYEHGIPKRSRGGANMTAKQRWRIFRSDQRYIYWATNEKISNDLHIDKSTVYKYKRDSVKGVRKLDANVHNQSNNRPGPLLEFDLLPDGAISDE